MEEISPDKFVGVQKLKKYTVSYFWDHQQKDPETSNIIEKVRLNDPSPKFKLYSLWNGVLLVRKGKKVNNKGLRIVLPTGTVTRMICDLHGVTHTSHATLKNMMKRFYYHPRIGHISKIIAQSCQVCGVCKAYTHKILPLGALALTKRPGQLLYLDFMSMSKVQGAKQVAKYLLVIVDAFSSYIMAFPTIDMEAGTVIKILRHITNTVPNIQTMVSDNQTSLLINKNVASFLERQQIAVKTVIAYSSKSNLSENANKQVRSMLRIYQLATGLNWLVCLDTAMKALNSISHTHGKMGSVSPFELFFRMPPDFQDPLKSNSISETMLQEKLQVLKEIRELRYKTIELMTKERLEKSQIKEGGLVRLLNINRTDKQTPNYLPNTFRITKLHNHLVMLQDVENHHVTHRVHIDRIKPIHQMTTSVVNHLRPKQLEVLGQDPKYAKASSSITDLFADSEDFNNLSDSADDLDESEPELPTAEHEPDITVDPKVLSAKTIITSDKKAPDFKASKSVVPALVIPKTIITSSKTIIKGIPEVKRSKSKVTLTPKKKGIKSPSVISVSPSDSISQAAGKAKASMARSLSGVIKMFKKLTPDRKVVAKPIDKTPVKYVIEKQQVTIATPISPKEIKDEIKLPKHSTPKLFRTRKESDESPEKFYSPDSSPEQKAELMKIIKTSTALQGAIPKKSSKFQLKPSKLEFSNTPLVKHPPIIREKRKALSPSKDELETPETKVVVRSSSTFPLQNPEGRPKRNLARIDYKLLHTKGIRQLKSPE